MADQLALLGQGGATRLAQFSAALAPAWVVKAWAPGQPEDALAEALAQARAVVVGPDALLSGKVQAGLARATRLELLQIPFSGHDWLQPGMLPSGCTACNVYEHHTTIAEYVMLAILESAIGLRRIDASFRAGSWAWGGSAASGRQHGEVRGKTVGILGHGRIGSEIARRASAFDMRVIACGSRARPDAPAPLAWWGGPESLDRLFAQSDYLVLACPLTDQTRGVVNARSLALMRPDAVLVNVARGPVADEDALFEALKSRRLGGAVLDTWYHYPTPEQPAPAPSRHDFASLDNVVMTPHCAAWTAAQDERRWTFIAANLMRLARGEALQNVVIRPRG